MKILFVVSDLFISEPHGVMVLSAICKQHRHDTKLLALKRASFVKTFLDYKPDLIAYSCTSPEIKLFAEADRVIKGAMKRHGQRVVRIMGGPHPTFFPDVLQELDLDAICIGEGDRAIVTILERMTSGESLENIPNILERGGDLAEVKKELISDLENTPFLDREAFYEAAPIFKLLGLRSVMTSRGCPYNCTYCHNNAYNKMFAGYGKVVRRRPVDAIIAEIKSIVENYQPVKMIRFSADTFAHTIDDWLIDLLSRYKREIGLPFYCLMRSNTLTDDMAKLLAESGCVSMSMAVESGNEEVRNKILKRNLSDDLVIKSFQIANKYNIKTYGNTILGIPGSTYEDDYKSFLFTRNVGLTVPTFSVFSPFRGTDLTNYAITNGWIDMDSFNLDKEFWEASPLNYLSSSEKNIQVNITFLGTLFCRLPSKYLWIFEKIIKMKPNFIFKFVGTSSLVYFVGKHIFPNIYNLNPIFIVKLFMEAIRFQIPRRNFVEEECAAPDGSASHIEPKQ